MSEKIELENYYTYADFLKNNKHHYNEDSINVSSIVSLKSSVHLPKFKNGWYINLPESLDLNPAFCVSTSRPVVNLKSDNNYEPIWIYFKDPIGPSTTQRLWHMYLGISGIDLVKSEEFKSIKENGFIYFLELINIDFVIEKWEIEVSEILEFDFGRLDYNSDEHIVCGIKVQPKSITLYY